MRKLEDFGLLWETVPKLQSPACTVITVNCRISLPLSCLSTDSLFYSQIDSWSLCLSRGRDSRVGRKVTEEILELRCMLTWGWRFGVTGSISLIFHLTALNVWYSLYPAWLQWPIMNSHSKMTQEQPSLWVILATFKKTTCLAATAYDIIEAWRAFPRQKCKWERDNGRAYSKEEESNKWILTNWEGLTSSNRTREVWAQRLTMFACSVGGLSSSRGDRGDTLLQYELRGKWMTACPSTSSSSNRCLLVAMTTSPSVPPYGEAGRLEDILEKWERKSDWGIQERHGRDRDVAVV